MPQVSASPSVHCQLRPVDLVVEKKRERVEIVPQLLKWNCKVVCLQPRCVHVKNGHDTVARRLFHREQVTPQDTTRHER